MRPGDTFVGHDGTAYIVVRPRFVSRDQLRWWIDRRHCRMDIDDYNGPDSTEDLHLIPYDECDDVALGLVLP